MFIICVVKTEREVFKMAVEIEKTRVNLNFPIETLKRVDEYAENMSINRTAAIMVLLNMALDSKKAMNDLSELLEIAKKESDKVSK